MTREEMEQIVSLQAEIRSIEASMRSPKSTYVSVFYKDYRTGKGIPKSKQELDDGESELKMLRTELLRQRRKLLGRIKKAEAFIKSVDDSEMRTILRSYYINGQNQKDIGKELHYSQTAISTKLRMFWLTQGDTRPGRSKRR